MITCQRLIISYSYTGGSDNNKGKSKKWKKILQFPHITQCLDLIQKISKLFASMIAYHSERKHSALCILVAVVHLH